MTPPTEEIAGRRVPLHTMVYAIGNLLSRSVGFILLPLYTTCLSPSEYGIIETVDISIALLTQLLIVRFDGGMVRFFFDRAPGKSRNRLVATTLVLIVAIVAVVWLMAIPLAPRVAEGLFRGPGDVQFVHLAFGVLFLAAVGQVPFSVMKAREQSVRFVILSLIKVALEVALKVYVLVILAGGVTGLLWASLIALAVITVPSAWSLIRATGLGFDRAEASRVGRFAAPLILFGVCSFALHSADRYMLRWLLPGDDRSVFNAIGTYALAYKFGFLAAMVVLDPFSQIWLPFLYSIRDEAKRLRFMARGTTWFLGVMVWATLALAIGSAEPIEWLAAPEYHGSIALVPVIAAGYFFWSIASLVMVGFLIARRTRPMPVLVAAAAGLNAILNAYWIPRYGVSGAAWATTVTFFGLVTVAVFAVRRVIDVDYEWSRIGHLLLVGGALFGVGLSMKTEGWWQRAMVDAIVIVGFPVVLALTRFVVPEEWVRVKEFVRERRDRSRVDHR